MLLFASVIEICFKDYYVCLKVVISRPDFADYADVLLRLQGFGLFEQFDVSRATI